MGKSRKMIMIREVIDSRKADTIDKSEMVVDVINEASKRYGIIGLNFSGLSTVTTDFLTMIVRKKVESENCEIYMCNLDSRTQELLLNVTKTVIADAVSIRR